MRVLRQQWFFLTSGLLCFFWAALAWLTIIPNQDILADAIQAQSILSDPRIVLAFPGQRHAGTVEYPIQVFAEWLAPGNYYVHTVGRVFLAGLTGFVVAKLFCLLYPKAPRWLFLIGVAVGPAIIQGISGPRDNPVGNFWLVGNYSTSWLLVSTGAWILAGNLSRPRPRLLVSAIAGLFVGLGFFAHPNVTLLILPLAVLVLCSFRFRAAHVAISLAGVALGVLPAVVSYFVNAEITTWDPSHPPFVSASIYMNILGLTGIPLYFTVVLPYAIGLPVSQELFPGAFQSFLTWVFVTCTLLGVLLGTSRALIQRRSLTPGATLALAWLAAFGAMILFATFVDPVWFYATSLSVMLWITIGALPNVVPWAPLGWVGSAALVLTATVSSFSQTGYFYRDIPHAMATKHQYLSDIKAAATALEAEGVGYLYGAYYDVIPIGYASAQRLRTIANHYDRFPIDDAERRQRVVVVAVRDVRDGYWGEEAAEHIDSRCERLPPTVSTAVGEFLVYRCPVTAIDSAGSS